MASSSPLRSFQGKVDQTPRPLVCRDALAMSSRSSMHWPIVTLSWWA